MVEGQDVEGPTQNNVRFQTLLFDDIGRIEVAENSLDVGIFGRHLLGLGFVTDQSGDVVFRVRIDDGVQSGSSDEAGGTSAERGQQVVIELPR
jgi:hypothetical protein